MNGTTWLDRTNYFETLPSHQLELALWLEADRMATLLDALSQENLDNQREVVKNEKRWSYDNRPYGSWNEKLQGHLFPAEHPYHHPTIGSMEDLDAASLEDVSAFFRTYYAPNNAVLSVVGDVDDPQVRRAASSATSAASRPTRRSRRARRPVAAADAREEIREMVPTACRCRGSTSGFRCAGLRRPAARRARGRRPDPRRRQGQPAPSAARPRRADRPGRRAVHARLRRRRVDLRRLGDGPPGRRRSRRVEAAFHEELERLAAEPVTDDELAAGKALIEADELGALQRVEERADRLSMYATLFDDPELINEHAAALPRGHRRADPRRGARSSRPTTASC